MALGLLLAGCNCNERVGMINVSVEASPRSLDFGLVAPGSTRAQTLTLTARGAAVSVARLSVREDNRGSFLLGAGPQVLGVGVPETLEVEYAPAQEGAETASLVITFADGIDELVVPLIGRALTANTDAGTGDAGAQDAGPVDAGPVDAGPVDAGLVDAGPVDAGPVDAGLVDAGLVDAGALDAGIDAGLPDAGPDDAGVLTRFDGGACVQNEGLGHARWPSFGSVNLAELHWEGSDYAVFFYNSEGWFARLDPAGQPQTSALVQVTPGLSSASLSVRAARGPTEWGVVYADYRGAQGACYFARVSPAGAVVAGSELILPGGSAANSSGSIAFNPLDQEWGVLWGVGDLVSFARISLAGALVAGSQRSLASSPLTSRLALARSLIWAQDRWVATWADASGVKLVELDRAGNVQSSSLTTVSPTGGAVFDPAVAQGSTEYGVVWQHDADVRFARVNRGGSVVTGSQVVLSPSDGGVGGSADLVWDGVRYFVAFSKQGSALGTNQLTAVVTVDGNGQPGPVRIVTCGGPGDDFFPRVSWNGSLHSVAYMRQYIPSGTTVQEGRVLLIP